MIVIEDAKIFLPTSKVGWPHLTVSTTSGKARQIPRNFIKSAPSKPLFGGEALLLSLLTPAPLRCESFRGTRAFLGELKEEN